MILLCRLVVLVLLVVAVYPYTIYPAILWLLARLRPNPWTKEKFQPAVSVLIAAHNEAAILDAKLRNTLEIDYPADRLQIIVASDGSTDETDQIADRHAPRVQLIRLDQRAGKQATLNRAASHATGDILVFTDAAVYLPPESIGQLAQNFADPAVGAVSSVIRITKNSRDGLAAPEATTSVDAEGAYLNLDLTTRRLESILFSAVGCAGACYAVRRECFIPFHDAACNDFVSALDAVRLGYRAVVEPRAVGYMLPAKTILGEFRRKARTIAGGLDTLMQRQSWPSPTQFPVFWWSLISHKVLRWLGPIVVLAVAVVSVIGGIAGDPVLLTIAILGLLALLTGVAALQVPLFRRFFPPARIAAFALVAWAAAWRGWFLFLTGKRQILWQPTAR